MNHRKNTDLILLAAARLVVVAIVLLLAFSFSSTATAVQLTPTSTLLERDLGSAWDQTADEEQPVEFESMDFLDSGQLPQSVEQLRAMQVRFKSLAEQVKDATVSITMRSGQGTGVLVSSDGVILTAAHVIGGPRRGALITFRDGTRAHAVTLGVESRKDSGMLKILKMIEEEGEAGQEEPGQEDIEEEAAPGELPAPGEQRPSEGEGTSDADDTGDDGDDSTGAGPDSDSGEKGADVIERAFANTDLPFFSYLDVGLSNRLKDGQWVMAVGHPGGWDKDRGMVVRVGRIINQSDTSLRSDCTLVGGDSGGPLVDMAGNLIAIHSRIGGRIQDNIHVPIDVFSDTWDKLSSGFKIGERGRLGLSVSSDSNIVSRLQKYGPADKAGIQVGDIIAEVGTRKIIDKPSLERSLKGRYPFEKLPVKVKRGSQLIDVEVMLVDNELLNAIKRREESFKPRKQKSSRP